MESVTNSVEIAGMGESNVEEFFANMRRCTKCILPETFPRIIFDQNGVCNYCSNYEPLKIYGEEAFEKLLDEYRDKGEKYDCVVPVSGGRDSAFVLYNVVKKYNMRSVAVTIDFGFCTNEAIQNLEKMTEILNVGHVVLKDENVNRIAKHNLKKRFHAWLKKPSINLILPMITPADKTQNWKLYRYAKENKIPSILLGSGTFEQEHFKTGFLGVLPDERGMYKRTDKIKLGIFFGYECMKNPHYFRWSILGELTKMFYIYFFGPSDLNKPKDIKMLDFYDYIRWNEREILSTITEELRWKGATDTTTTWRIGDRYSSLYNYLYFKLVGFTEHDEMYSKMIREGQISREEAMKRCMEDHTPRIPSLMDIFDELEVTKEQVDKVLQKYRVKLLSKIMKLEI